MLPSLQLVVSATVSSFGTGFGKERVGVWSSWRGSQEPHAPNPCLLWEDSVGTRECWMPGKVWAPWSFVRTVWLDTLSKLGQADHLLSLQSGKETAEKSNHLLGLYLALECFVWRQSNENHPKEVLCWWENYERPKKGVIKKFAVQAEL